MDFGRILDRAIEPFAPATAARRMAARIGAEQIRGYEVAQRGRRTKGWDRPLSSADAENARGRTLAASSAQDLFRNNKYANAACRQMVAAAWGDGIAPMMVHPDKAVQTKAQDGWDRWAEGKVSDQNDWYGHGKVAVLGQYVGGETLTAWKPDATGPDGRVVGLEGDHLDMAKTEERASGARIVQGVEFNADDERSQYWLFRDHPGDVLFRGNLQSQPVPAQYVDHLFETTRFGQTRGVSRLAATAMTLRDVADIEDARRLQEKVAACVALILQSQEGSSRSPLDQTPTTTPSGKDIESVNPGMILRPPPGVTAHSFTPAPSSGGTEFIRQQLAAVSASMVPYHLMTGDVSQANYSGLRASFLGQWGLLDDDQQNVIIPLLCKPAADRRMRRLAMETGDRRFLEVRYSWALPVRRQADPIKDLMAEIIEIRGGLKLLSRSLAERGINAEEHLAQIAQMNSLIDTLGLALESDPRRLTDSGVLQAAVGYILPKGGQDASAA